MVLQVPNNTNFTTYQLDSVSMITNDTMKQLFDDTVSITFLLSTDTMTIVAITLSDVQGVNLVFEYTISKILWWLMDIFTHNNYYNMPYYRYI